MGILKVSGIAIILLVKLFLLLLNGISFQNGVPVRRWYVMKLVLPWLASVGLAGSSWGGHLYEGRGDGPKGI